MARRGRRETDARLLQLESRVIVLEESVAPCGESTDETVSQQIEHLAGLHDQLNKSFDEHSARNEERLAAVQAQLDAHRADVEVHVTPCVVTCHTMCCHIVTHLCRSACDVIL